MEKLEQLIQDEKGNLFRENKEKLYADDYVKMGKLKTFVVENPCIEISNEINKRIGTEFIPKHSNAYVVSEFNANAQILRDNKIYSVYGIQFYLVFSDDELNN